MSDATLDYLMQHMIPPDAVTPYFRGLFYGPEGSRKTTQAMRVGGLNTKTLLIESDPEGYVSLINHPELLRKMVRLPYEGVSMLEAIANRIHLPEFDQFATIVVDTVSQVSAGSLDLITSERLKAKKLDEEVPDWPAYNLSGNQIRRAITKLMKCNKHVVLTSHHRQREDKIKILRTSPNMPDQLRNDLTRMCHVVAYLTAELNESTGEYTTKAQVHPTKTIVAKSRIGGLPVIIENPDFGLIVDTWLKNGASLAEEEKIRKESEGITFTASQTSDNSDNLEI